jgi:pimeloyl-ACP methyl ester carboxylesterase
VSHFFFKIGILAHSLGCGIALQWAAFTSDALYIDRFVLLAPFTSVLHMAHRMVGDVPGLRYLLSHEYNNVASLNTLYDRRTRAYSNYANACRYKLAAEQFDKRDVVADTSSPGDADDHSELKCPTEVSRHLTSPMNSWNVRVTLCHGVNDRVIPVQMGRTLAKTGIERAKQTNVLREMHYTETTTAVAAINFAYIEYPADHNDIISVATNHIFQEFTD